MEKIPCIYLTASENGNKERNPGSFSTIHGHIGLGSSSLCCLFIAFPRIGNLADVVICIAMLSQGGSYAAEAYPFWLFWNLEQTRWC